MVQWKKNQIFCNEIKSKENYLTAYHLQTRENQTWKQKVLQLFSKHSFAYNDKKEE